MLLASLVEPISQLSASRYAYIDSRRCLWVSRPNRADRSLQALALVPNAPAEVRIHSAQPGRLRWEHLSACHDSACTVQRDRPRTQMDDGRHAITWALQLCRWLRCPWSQADRATSLLRPAPVGRAKSIVPTRAIPRPPCAHPAVCAVAVSSERVVETVPGQLSLRFVSTLREPASKSVSGRFEKRLERPGQGDARPGCFWSVVSESAFAARIASSPSTQVSLVWSLATRAVQSHAGLATSVAPSFLGLVQS